MITAGIDAGNQTVKAVILKDGSILGHSIAFVGADTEASAQQALDEALKMAGLSRDEVGKVFSTGAGRKLVSFVAGNATETTCDARGAVWLLPATRTVIDVGAEEGRAVRCDAQGKVTDFSVNEKCGAGSGTFTEAMARALEVSLEDFGQMSLRSQQNIQMNAQCVVFAESEVVSLIHAQTPKEDIARAVHDAIADRITSLTHMVGMEKEVALIGGVARNPGFVDALRRSLGCDISVPDDPQIVGALGAALMAAG